MPYHEMFGLEIAGDGFVYLEGKKIAKLVDGSVEACAGKKLNHMGLIIEKSVVLGMVMRMRFKQPLQTGTAQPAAPKLDSDAIIKEEVSVVPDRIY